VTKKCSLLYLDDNEERTVRKSMLIPDKNHKNPAAKSLRSLEKSRINTLTRNLRSKDGHLMRESRESLAFIGKSAVPPLIMLLKDPDEDVRWEAAKTLALISDPEAASELVAALEDRNFGVRWIAAEALINIGREALPPLLHALIRHSDSPILRNGAHHVLSGLARKGFKTIVGPILAALEGVEPEVVVLGSAYTALDRLKEFGAIHSGI
jgi:HEAT repeat protein